MCDGKAGEALAREHELVTNGAADAGVECLHALLDAVLCGGDEFGGSGRCGSAEVGDEVCDGEVGFVADSGDYGQTGCGNGAGKGLVVEAGEIFDRPPPRAMRMRSTVSGCALNQLMPAATEAGHPVPCMVAG